MTENEYTHKLDQLDRLLNDPDVPMEPAKVWSLLAEISVRHSLVALDPLWQPPPAAAHIRL